MDEISEKALETSVSLVMQPVVGVVQDLIGITVGDWLHETRTRNRRRLEQKTREVLQQRGIERLQEPNPTTVAPIITAAQDETREELLDVWARLLAVALDPNHSNRYRREFVASVRELEPNDVAVLLVMEDGMANRQSQAEVVAEKCGLSLDETRIALRNLIRTGCCMTGPAMTQYAFPHTGVFVSPLGRELMALLSPSKPGC